MTMWVQTMDWHESGRTRGVRGEFTADGPRGGVKNSAEAAQGQRVQWSGNSGRIACRNGGLIRSGPRVAGSLAWGMARIVLPRATQGRPGGPQCCVQAAALQNTRTAANDARLSVYSKQHYVFPCTWRIWAFPTHSSPSHAGQLSHTVHVQPAALSILLPHLQAYLSIHCSSTHDSILGAASTLLPASCACT